jgi:signal peptidase complex subunit 1
MGYIQQDFMMTIYGWGAGLLVALVVCVPDWPWFNRHPVKWLDEVPPQKRSQ